MTDTPAPRDRVPPWERAEFRFWVGALTVVVILALALSVVAIAVAGSDEDGGSGGGEKAVTAGAAVAAFPGEEIDVAGDPGPRWEARDPAAPPRRPGPCTASRWT